MNKLADWTILTYIAAHNNLDTYGERSRDQILAAGSGGDSIQRAVLFDSWQGAARQIAGQPAEKLGSFDSGDPTRLLETTQWAFEKCPAKRYGLVLWSHGSGYWNQKELQKIAHEARGPQAQIDDKERDAAGRSMALFRSTLHTIFSEQDPAERAILFDDGTQHSLDTLQLAAVCQDIAKVIGQPLDLLGMDACLMATLEVAYEVREHARVLVASEELVPGNSWPYDVILNALAADPGMDAAALGRAIVQAFKAYYTAHPPGAGDVTQTALDLSCMAQLAAPIKQLADCLRQTMPAVWQMLWAAQSAAYQKEVAARDPKFTKFGYHLWDVRSLALGLAERANGTNDVALKQAAQAVVAVFDAGAGCAVLANAKLGEWFADIGGSSIYMTPMDAAKRMSKQYAELAFAKDTGWGAMLKAYRAQWA